MKTSSKTQSIAMIGMFTAVLAVLSILQIPMPSGVPITLQTFAVALCGYCLGKKNGTLCVALYCITERKSLCCQHTTLVFGLQLKIRHRQHIIRAVLEFTGNVRENKWI